MKFHRRIKEGLEVEAGMVVVIMVVVMVLVMLAVVVVDITVMRQ